MTLAPITHSAEQIGAPYQPSLNAAFADLASYFGFWPVVKAPVGGARTKAQCNALGTSWQTSDHYEDRPARAADIDNHRRFRNINQAAFLWILAMHGWHNMTISGHAFPDEPWHFANHDAHPQQAGGGLVPIPPEPIEKDETMTDFLWLIQDGKPSTDGTIKPLMSFYQKHGGAPVLKLHDDYRQSSERTALVNGGVKETAISGDGLLALVALRGWAPAKETAGTIEVGEITVPADPALLAAVQALGPKLDAVLAATNRLNPPG